MKKVVSSLYCCVDFKKEIKVNPALKVLKTVGTIAHNSNN